MSGMLRALGLFGTLTRRQRPHNLLLWSEQFENAVWAKTRITVSINVTTAPNGTSTAEKLVEDTANGTHVVAQSYSTFLSGERYTFSVSVKKSERPSVRITLPSTAFTANIYGHFNLETGTLVGASPGVTATISSEGDGWYRCSVSGIATSTAVGTATIFTGNEANSINVSYTGDGTSGIFVWGAQLNQGDLQPYRPTVGAAM